MIYPYNVNYNGVFYAAGTEVPVADTTKEKKAEQPKEDKKKSKSSGEE